MSIYEMLLRPVVAVLLGGIIGVERESKHRPAGFRTHILVCLGAATIMMMSEMLFERYYYTYNVTPDPARLGAQVISGIGFLGAGTIMRYGPNVKGLTTAASIWAVGCIGLVVGAGYYLLALFVTGLLFVTLISFSKFYQSFEQRGAIRDIVVQMRNDDKTLGAVTKYLTFSHLSLLKVETSKNQYDDEEENELLDDDDYASLPLIKVVFTVQIETGTHYYAILTRLSEIEGVSKVENI